MLLWSCALPLLVVGAESFFSDKSFSAIVAILAFIVLILIIMRRTPGRSTLGDGRERVVRGSGIPHEARQPLRGEAERLLVELQEFGREIEGRLETRIHHLTRLIAEADRAVERLNAHVTAADAAAEAEAEDTPSAGPEPSDRDKTRARIMALAEDGMPPEAIAEAVGLPKGEVELMLGLGRKVVDRDS